MRTSLSLYFFLLSACCFLLSAGSAHAHRLVAGCHQLCPPAAPLPRHCAASWEHRSDKTPMCLLSSHLSSRSPKTNHHQPPHAVHGWLWGWQQVVGSIHPAHSCFSPLPSCSIVLDQISSRGGCGSHKGHIGLVVLLLHPPEPEDWAKACCALRPELCEDLSSETELCGTWL